MSLALKYLKNNKQAFPYFTSLLFSNICMVLSINIIFNKPNVLLEAFALCMICFFVCLTFILGYQFVKSESRMIGLFKLSGCSFSGILKYLGVQYCTITAISLMISMLLGTALTYAVKQSFTIINTFFLLVFLNATIIFYMLFVSLGEIYRHEIMDFIRNQDTIDVSSFTFKSLGFTVPYLASLVVYFLLLLIMFYSNNSESAILVIVGVLTYVMSRKVVERSFDGYLKAKMKKSKRLNQNIMTTSHVYLIQKCTINSQMMLGISMLFYYLVAFLLKEEPMILFFNYLMLLGIFIVYHNQLKKINQQLQKEYELLLDEGLPVNKVTKLYQKTMLKSYVISLVLTLLPIIVYMYKTSFSYSMILLVLTCYSIIYGKEYMMKRTSKR